MSSLSAAAQFPLHLRRGELPSPPLHRTPDPYLFPFPAPDPTPLRASSRFEEKANPFGFLGRSDLAPPHLGAGALGSRGGSRFGVGCRLSRACKARGLGRRVDSLAWGADAVAVSAFVSWDARVVCHGVMRCGDPFCSEQFWWSIRICTGVR